MCEASESKASAKLCRILHTSIMRKRRLKDPSCAKAPSVGLVIVVPHCTRYYCGMTGNYFTILQLTTTVCPGCYHDPIHLDKSLFVEHQIPII